MLGRHTLSLLLLLATGVLSGYGQQHARATSLFSIDGTVRDNSDQRGMENIRVDLRLPAGNPVSTTFTRGNGDFEFSDIANGEYIIEVNAQDYVPLQQSVEIMNSGRRGVSLFLTRSGNRLNSNLNGGIISAHQLSAPRKAQDEFDKGINLLYAKSDYRGAITQFQRAIKDFPTYYEAYALEGTAYQTLGDTACCGSGSAQIRRTQLRAISRGAVFAFRASVEYRPVSRGRDLGPESRGPRCHFLASPLRTGQGPCRPQTI